MLMTIHCIHLVVTWMFSKKNYTKTFGTRHTVLWQLYSFQSWKVYFHVFRINLTLDKILIYKDFKIKNTSVNEILGVIIDRERKFYKHVKHIYKKVSNMLNTLTRVANILNPFQKNTLFKSFIKGQFNYCPLLWMFFSRSSNNLINKIHERALNSTSGINDIAFSLNGLSPPRMFDLFTTREKI